MKKYYLSFAAWLMLSSCAISSRSTFLESMTSKSNLRDSVDIKVYSEKYAKYDGVYLNVEETLEHNAASLFLGPPEWTFFRVRNIKYLVLNPDNQRLSSFGLSLKSNQALRKVHLKCISPMGKTSEYTLSHLKLEKNSNGSHEYRFVYPDVVKGTLIEEGYEIENVNLLQNPLLSQEVSLQYDLPIERIKFQYKYPDWWQVMTKNTGENKVRFATTFDPKNHKTIYSYEDKDVPAVHEELFSPYFKEMGKYTAFSFAYLELGSITYRAPSSWADVANQYKNYAMDRVSFLSKVLANNIGIETERVTRMCKRPLQKLDSIVTYIQTNMEVGNEAKDFDELLTKKKGNIYLITGLAQAMLVKAELDAKYVLIHNAQDGNFDKQYITSSEMYIPAVTVTLDEKTYVVFPYVEYLPITYIPDAYQGQEAMKISKDGFAGFFTVPEGSGKDNGTYEKYELTIGEDGTIEVDEEKTLSGSEAFAARRELTKLKEEEKDQVLKKLLTYSEGNVTMVSSQFENLRDHRRPLIIRLRYKIDNLVTVTPDEAIFQTGGLFSPSSKIKYKVDAKGRHNPIRIYNDQEFSKDITVHYPEKWSLSTTLQDLRYENRFGFIEGHYTIGKTDLRVNQKLQINKSYQPKETIDELWLIAGKSSRLQLPNLVFKVGN